MPKNFCNAFLILLILIPKFSATTIEAVALLILWSPIKFSLIFNISNSDGYSQDVVYGITVGTANQHDPLGPDEYGYYIYDWLDVGYISHSTY